MQTARACVCVRASMRTVLGEIISNFHHTLEGPRDPRAGTRRRCTDLVMKAYVNEVPVLQARRVQDGAEVTVELVASDQVVFRRPASTTKHTGKRVSYSTDQGTSGPPPASPAAASPGLTTFSPSSGSRRMACTISGHTSHYGSDFWGHVNVLHIQKINYIKNGRDVKISRNGTNWHLVSS